MCRNKLKIRTKINEEDFYKEVDKNARNLFFCYTHKFKTGMAIHEEIVRS